MTGWNNILHDLFGAVLIVAVLAALAVIAKLIVDGAQKLQAKREATQDALHEDSAPAVQYAQGELELVRTDEKTAALIMGIVSYESGIPLDELIFHSIKLID
ncbi:MAG: hypothetical protein ACM3S4_00605 [Burkholderiales bacterium]